jgi:hypothetical protein
MPPLLPPRLLLPPPARSCRRFATTHGTAAPMAMNTKNSALKIPATTGTLAHLKAVGQLPEGVAAIVTCVHIFFRRVFLFLDAEKTRWWLSSL